ncbi:MAG: HPF/RaiA family ribosome-associated protein [Acidimicrobiales bacterium]
MEIVFRIRNVDLPDRVLAATRDKLTRLGRRWPIDRAEVCFSEERNPRIAKRERCVITWWGPSLWGKGRILRAEALAGDAGVAANRVMGVLERRANKAVGRLTVHFLPNWSPMGLLSTPDDRRGSVGACGGVAGIGDIDSDAEAMMPEDAAFEMLAWDQDRWRFVNAETGRTAVLQRRPDGAIAMAELVVDTVAQGRVCTMRVGS